MDMSNARFDGDRPASEAPELVPEGCFCPSCGENRMDWLKKLTHASKYECRVSKHVGAVVSRQGNDHLVEWAYVKGPWQYNEQLETALRDHYPFSPLKAEGRYRYEFS